VSLADARCGRAGVILRQKRRERTGQLFGLIAWGQEY